MWFIVGGLVGWAAAQGGPAVQRSWPVFLRVQILATSATLSLVAAWRLTSVGQLLGPLALSAGMWLLLGATLLSRGKRSAGQSSLEAWAVTPNASFWVVPTAAAFAGSAGTQIAVLANVITTAWNAVAVHLMRRDAPFPQRRSTTWVDQSPVLASLVGLLLHAVGPAPAWTADVLTLAGPLLAFSGAALFTGSVIHPHNLAVPRTVHAVRRWAWLTVVRVAYYALVATVAWFAGSNALAVVAVLTALSAPSFQPIQLSVLYGYRSEVVVAAVRWGWILAPARLGRGGTGALTERRGSVRRAARGRRRTPGTQAPVLHPVPADRHVAPCPPARMGTVVVGPATVRVPTRLEPRPGAVSLRVAHDQQQHSQRRVILPRMDFHGPVVPEDGEQRGRLGEGAQRRQVGAVGAVGAVARTVADEQRPDTFPHLPGLCQVDPGAVGQPDLAQPARALDGIFQQIVVGVTLPGVHEGLEHQ